MFAVVFDVLLLGVCCMCFSFVFFCWFVVFFVVLCVVMSFGCSGDLLLCCFVGLSCCGFAVLLVGW